MPNHERGEGTPEQDPEQTEDLAWLKEHITVFWPAARSGYEQDGRGAIIIDTASEPLEENTQFHYALQAAIEEQEDAASLRLARLVSEYDPEREFLAAIIKPGMEVSTYQVEVGEELIEAVKDYADSDFRPGPAPTEPEAEATLEPPDLETLMAWEDEGGCEAACPHNCWIEPDGTCTHGHPSWLLKLDLI